MRRVLLGCVVLGCAVMALGTANAQVKTEPTIDKNGVIIRDHRTKPDLRIGDAISWLDGVLLVPVTNHEGNGNNKPSKIRVKMYKETNGKEALVATAFGDIPVVESGKSTKVTVVFLQQKIANCRLVVDIDYLNQVVELNEANNTRTFKIK